MGHSTFYFLTLGRGMKERMKERRGPLWTTLDLGPPHYVDH